MVEHQNDFDIESLTIATLQDEEVSIFDVRMPNTLTASLVFRPE